MKENSLFKRGTVLFLCFILIFSGFSPIPTKNVSAKENIDIEDTVPMFANKVKNPELKFSGGDDEFLTIENWDITLADNLMDDGEVGTEEKYPIKMNHKDKGSNWRGLATIRTAITGTEKIEDRYSHYELIHGNNGDNEVFRGKARAVKANDNKYDGKHMYDEGWAFYSLSQTVDLEKNEDYVFRMDYDTDSAANFLVRVYPGEKSSGDGYLKSDDGYEFVSTVTKGDGVQHLEFDLSAAENESGKATVAIRHIPRKGEDDDAGELHIYRVGLYLKADYELQKKVGELFTDSDKTALKYNGETLTEAIDNMQDLINRIENKRNNGTDYHADVKTYVDDALKNAQGKLQAIEGAKKGIDEAYAAGWVDQAEEDKLKYPVIRLPVGAFQTNLYNLIDLNRLKQEVLEKVDEKEVTDDKLTEEEQLEEQSQLKEAIEKARVEIKNATTENEVLVSIKELSSLHIEILATLTNKKIANLKHLSQATLDESEQDVKKELDKRLAEINVADSAHQAELPVPQGKFILDKIYNNLVEDNDRINGKKKQLKKDLQEEAQQAKAVVDGLEGLIEEEKNTQKAVIEQALNEAINNIEKAAGTDNAEKAKQAGSLAIEKIKGKAEIDAAEELALEALKGLNLGDKAEEKENAINDAANKARTDIDKVIKIDDVAGEVTTGKEKINNVLGDAQFEDVKNNAKDDIVNKAQEAIDHINEKENVSEGEKTTLITDVNTAKDTALSGIDNANTENGVDKAVKNAETAFDLAQEKANAIANLQVEAREALKAVEEFKGLSEDEQTATKELINQELAAGIENIKKADSKTEVTNAEEDGSLTIYRKKEKAEIDGHKNKALTAFNKLENLGEDKDKLKDAIVQVADEAKSAMDTRDSKNGITSELNKGMTNIDEALANAKLQDAKNMAKADIASKAQAAKQMVEKQELLTEDEVAAANEAIDQAKESVNTNIDKATTNKQINDAVDEGNKAIDLAEKKAVAKEDLREKDVSTEDSIDKLKGIDQETKDAARRQVEAALEKSLTDVDNASNTKEVNTAVVDGKEAMKKILDDLRTESNDNLEHARANAKEELTAEGEKAKAAVDKLSLSEEEKQAAKAAIDQRVNDALAQVKDAEDFTAIEKEKGKGLVSIEQEKAQAEVDALQALTEEEKNAVKNKVNKAADDAKAAIDGTETVEDAKAETNKEISNIELDVDKAEATDAINKAQKDALAEIQSLNDLTDGEKEEKEQAIKGAASNAKKQIDDATDKSEVTTAVNDGKAAINTVVDEAKLQDFKNKAKADIANKEAIAKSELEDLKDVTETERESALAAIKEAVTDANTAIDETTDKTTISDAKDDAYRAIDKAFNKANAQDEIRHHATNTNQYIDDLEGVDDKAKDKAKSEIDQIQKDAITALEDTDAGMDDIVKQAKKDMDDIYDNIVTESNENIKNAKDNAKIDLSKEAQNAIDKIKALPKLSQEDKEEAISKIKSAQAAGEKAIDNASSPGEATTVKDEEVVIFKGIVTDATLSDAKIQAEEDLQEKADATKAAIDALTEIGETEKENTKAAIDDALQEALGNVESAKNVSSVETAVNNGKNAMDDLYDALLKENNDAVEESKKKQKADLQAEADEHKQEIDALKHLSKEDKDAAKATIDLIATEAEAKIDEATSSQAMTDIKTGAVAEMKEEVTKATLADAKLDADKQLQAHAETVKDEVDALTGVSEEEKESAKKAIDDALSEATNSVNSADNVEKVKSATSAGKSAMDDIYNNIQGENNDNIADAKQKGKDELDRIAKDAKGVIDDLSHLSDEEKTTAKNAIDQAVEDGKSTIDNADSPEAITSAKEETLDKIKAETDAAKLANAKAKANESLQQKSDSINESIDALTGVSDDEKAKSKEEIKGALENAKNEVNNASDIPAVENAETAGKNAMQGIFDVIAKEDEENINLAKDKAKQELNDAATEAKEAIDKLSNITDEQRSAANAQVDEALNAGKTAIEDADSPESITKAKNAALNSIQDAQSKAELQNAQAKSKAEIQTHAKNTKAAVDALTGVSDDAKATAKKAIEDEVAKAEAAIDNATSIDAVTQAEKTGKSAIDGIYDNIEVQNEENIKNAKNAATEQLEDEAANSKEAIDNLPNLSDDEKAALKQEVDDAVATGKEAIKNAENPEDITQAKDEALNNIDKVVDKAKLQNAKHKAEQELQNKATSTKEAIDTLSGVDKAAKDKAVAVVDKALENALNDVQDANNIDAVDSAVTDGKAEMDRIYDEIVTDNNKILNAAKDKATEELEREAEAAKEKINKLPNLSDEEKQAAKDAIDDAVETGKAAIEKGESPEDITDLKQDTMESINKIVDDAKLDDEKVAAKKDLDQKAQSTKDAIDKLTGVSKSEKDTAKAEVDKVLETAKNAVDESEASHTVKQAVQDGKEQMDKIYNQVLTDNNENLTNAKAKAREELEGDAATAKDKIEQLENLRDEEKQAALDAIDEALEAGKAVIEKATSPGGISDAKHEAKENIDKITDASTLQDAQKEANKQLSQAADDAKEEIDQLDHLKDKEKQAAKDRVDEVTQAGKDIIKGAKTPEEVTSEKQAALNKVQGELEKAQLDNTKAKATEELTQNAASTKEAIDKLTGVSKADKQKAKDAIDKALSAAEQAVKDAKDIPTVEQATQTGKAEMEEVFDAIAKDSEEFIKSAKDQGIDELEKVAADAKKVIDELGNLTDEEKAAAKATIDDTLGDAKDSIKKAASPSGIEAAKDKAKDKVKEIVDQAKLDDEKAAATKALVDQANEIKVTINALPSLTDEEKVALKDKVDETLSAAKDAINKSKNKAEVQDALDKGQSALDAIYNQVEADNEEVVDTIIKALENDAAAAKEQIDQLKNLTDEEKDKAKAAIDDVLVTAKDTIKKANTSEALDAAKDKAKDEMDQIVIDAELLDEKTNAKNELVKKADAIKEQIDLLPGLTDDEKAVIKAQVDESLNKAKDAVAKAKDSKAVDEALNKGKSDMDGILKDAQSESKENLAETKETALKDLGNKAKKLKEQIEQLTNVTKDDKAAAKAAIDEALRNAQSAVDYADNIVALKEAIEVGEAEMDDIYYNVRVTILEAPKVTDIYDDAIIIEGEGIAGATVIAKVNGVEIARTTVQSKAKASILSLNNNGIFTLVLPKTLPAGTEVELIQTLGDVTSEPVTIKVLPKHNQELDLTGDQITKPEAGDTVITGKGEPGANILIKDKDGNVLGEGTVDKNSNFEEKLSRSLIEGEEISILQSKDGQEGEAFVLEVGPKLEDHGSKVDQEKEEQLPHTATNMYNGLLAGIVLLALGSLSLFIVRRRKSNE